MPQTNLAEARRRAKSLGVVVKPSTKKFKKLDVYGMDGKFLTSIGDLRYEDFLTHKDPERRRRYMQRHEKHRHTPGTASYYADKILW